MKVAIILTAICLCMRAEESVVQKVRSVWHIDSEPVLFQGFSQLAVVHCCIVFVDSNLHRIIITPHQKANGGTMDAP